MPDKYEVVWPLGREVCEAVPVTAGAPDLNGKTICELYDWIFRGEEIFPVIRESLRKRYPGVRFVDYENFGDTHGPQEKDVVGALPELFRKHGCDAVISGVGG